ncbi:MAG: hypothetical protein ICV83_06975 [Cytophagales bacterium]|nr:hypothetical protein [Cytophagales bacterium]
MTNTMIRDRLRSFQAELSQKGNDPGFTVSETCFICERAVLLIKDYSQPGIVPSKKQALVKLREATDQAEAYFDGRNRKRHRGSISHVMVVQPAREAITAFLVAAH